MTDLASAGLLVASIVGLIVGFRLLKFEKGNKSETVVYGKDILAVSLIVLSVLGTFLGFAPVQTQTAGAENAGFSVNRCSDGTNILAYSSGNCLTGVISSSNSTICTSTNGLCPKAQDNIVAIRSTLLLTTSSNTPISTGKGVTYTPKSSIKFLITGFTGSYLSGVQGTDGSFNVYVYYSPSAIPSMGSAPGGSDIQMDATTQWARQDSGIGIYQPFALVRTGAVGFNPLTLNVVSYWYIAVAWSAGGTGINIVDVQLTVSECINC